MARLIDMTLATLMGGGWIFRADVPPVPLVRVYLNGRDVSDATAAALMPEAERKAGYGWVDLYPRIDGRLTPPAQRQYGRVMWESAEGYDGK